MSIMLIITHLQVIYQIYNHYRGRGGYKSVFSMSRRICNEYISGKVKRLL